MPRIQPVEIDQAPGKSKQILEGVQKAIGFAPNIYKTLAVSPAVLEAFLGFGKTLGTGTLTASLREQIAVALAGANNCDYCSSAHTAIGIKHGLADDELAANLRGRSADPATQTALDFALAINSREGFVTDEQLQAVRDAGYTDEQVVEVFAETLKNIFTNYFNHIAQTDVDFPFVPSAQAAHA